MTKIFFHVSRRVVGRDEACQRARASRPDCLPSLEDAEAAKAHAEVSTEADPSFAIFFVESALAFLPNLYDQSTP